MGSSRRRLLASALALGAGLLPGCRTFLGHGPVRHPPVGTRSFVSRCFDGLERSRVWDMHAHLIGIGTGGTGCWVSEAYRTEPYKRFLFDLYMLAAGVEDLEDADRLYLERLLEQVRIANPEGKVVLMAFDVRVDENGEEDRERSEIYTPNRYVYEVASRYPEVKAAASIHPNRRDALDLLDEAKERGAVAVKWLPNSQGIDPASPKVDPFLKKMADLDLVLICHAGEEQAVDSKEDQALGNVLKLRRALDHGVRVVVAHCAGLGHGDDLDQPEGARARPESFDLFLRLMGEKQYEKNLFADISAMTQFNRSGRPLREVILMKELHPRLVNGSDYPLPAVNPLVSTRWLEASGYLEPRDRIACNEVFRVNPLLFDFVVKRRIRVLERGVEHRFSDVVFETSRLFDFARA